MPTSQEGGSSLAEDKPKADERTTTVEVVGNGETAQVMKFEEIQDPSWVVEPNSNLDPTFELGFNSGSADLADFLSRPVLLHTENIPISENLYRHAFKPWTSFFGDPVIQRKLHNFAYIKCKLHLKFVLNASPFHYSLIMASYRPLDSLNPLGRLIKINTTETTVQDSQMPHVMMEASTSTGGELVLPFLWPYNGLRIGTKDDFDNMGTATIQTITPLRTATATTTNVTISVFAWATDVTLSMSTSESPFVAQASKTKRRRVKATSNKDEYDKGGNGVVSGPASVVAKISEGLEQAPLIGPFARATTIGATAVANIARIFGFSRPISTHEILPYRNFVSGGTANTAGIDPIEKISLDPKQELTIDPRTVGLDSTDQMTLNTILCRDSFLTTFNWVESDAPGKLLWNSYVDPMLVRTDGTHIFPTAMAFGALPFHYWCGSIVFTFKFVATKYHKGRVVIHYDPKDSTISSDPSSTYTTSFSEVVDLNENEDIEISIPWSQMHPYGITEGFDSSYGSVALADAIGSRYNGLLSISVLNELTSSSDTSPIQVAVFVRCGDDIQMRLPSQKPFEYVPQGAEVAPSASNFVAQSSRVKSIVHANADKYDQDIDHVIFGDPIHSYRSLLKRYEIVGPFSGDQDYAAGESGITRYVVNQAPPARGYYTTGMYSTAAGDKFNYVNTTIMNYLKPAYAGYRGGVRYKWLHVDGSLGKISHARIYATPLTDQLTATTKFTGSNGSERAFSLLGNYRAGTTGMSITHEHTQQGLFYEVPFFSNARFFYSGAANGVGAPYKSHNLQTSVAFNYDNVSGITPEHIMMAAAAEDFSLFMFVAAPVLFDFHTLPAPV